MRLICPNCGAQYNVDDSVIPEAGRDVQCSSCGHGWFQQPDAAGRSQAARIAGQPGPRRDSTKIATAAPGPTPEQAEEQTGEQTGEQSGEQSGGQAERTDAGDTTETTAAAPERTGRRALDAAVMDVLREEAEREKAARAAETPTAAAPDADASRIVEQPAPGPAPEPSSPAPPPAPDERQVVTETHKARMRGENPAAAVAALSGRAAHRSEMLPDIEEINSTLRASSDPSRAAEEAGASDAAEKQKARRGFRMGFGLVAILALVATLLYTQGPRIAGALPGLAEPIARYVAAVNDGRRWLDDTLRGAGSD